MIDLSIVIVSWNTRALLLDCLAHVRGALEPDPAAACLLRAEVVVVDNGSRDGSVEAVRELHPGVELVALPENRGFAAGSNAGIAHSRGRDILLLNTDVRLERRALKRALGVLGERPEAGVVGMQLMHADGRRQNSIHAFPGLVTELLPIALLELVLPGRFPSKRYRHSGPIEVDAVQGAALLTRRRVVERVGPLPEEYFFFLEETAWCWRVREAGLTVLHVPGTEVVHRAGSSSRQVHPGATAIEYHRSLYRFLADHRGPATRDAAIALRTLRAAVSVLTNSLAAPLSQRWRRRARAQWAVLRWHVRGRPGNEGLAALASGVATRTR